MMSSGTSARSTDILLVEDNPVDVMIVQKAFGACSLPTNLHVAEDGEEAMDFLCKRGKFSSVRSPDVILLDLNVPKKTDSTSCLRSRKVHLCGIFLCLS